MFLRITLHFHCFISKWNSLSYFKKLSLYLWIDLFYYKDSKLFKQICTLGTGFSWTNNLEAIIWASTSVHDGIMRSRFNFSFLTTVLLDKILENNSFQKFYKKYKKLFSKRGAKTRWIYDNPSLPTKENFQTTVHWVGNQTEHNALNWEDKVWSSRESRQLNFMEQIHGEEGVTKKERSK